jgi:exocyst complex component 2
VEGSTVWIAIIALVKNLSETIARSLPLFWKIAKGYMDGRLKKVAYSMSRSVATVAEYPFQNSTASRRSPAQCRGMALELAQTYIDLLTSFFALSEEISSPSQGSPVTKSGWITPPTNSITTALYLNQIIASLSESINEMNNVTMEVAQGDTLGSGLKAFLESVRWKFTSLLSRCWKNGT